jgi:hypothetical protein
MAVLAALVLTAGCRDKKGEAPPVATAGHGADAAGSAPDAVGQLIGDDEPEVFLPHVREEMLSADFWIGRMAGAEPTLPSPDEVRLTPEEVAAYSRRILESSHGALQDLASFPGALSRAELAERALSWSPGDRPLFRDGIEVPREELDAVALNRNEAGMLDSNPVRLGTTWQRADLRMWPTAVPVFEKADDDRFDVFQATALDPAEPLVVLHESLDGRWTFVRAYNCDGWLPKAQVALVPNRADWLSLVAPERFLVVTGAQLMLGPDSGSAHLEGVRFLMGARLPLWPEPAPATLAGRSTAGSHVVSLPEPGPDGNARLVAIQVPASGDVHVGYLPYTRGNVVSQAFRMLGLPYGWGGSNGGVDCSAFIAGVYRTMGLRLPRNSGRQELTPGRSFLLHAASASNGPSSPTMESPLNAVPPGASLFLKGHTLIYLGNVEGRDYAIHAMSAYQSDGRKIPVFGVVVSDLSLVRTSGVSLADSLTSAVDLVVRTEAAPAAWEGEGQP